MPGKSGNALPRHSHQELTTHTSIHLEALTGAPGLPVSAFAAFAHLQRLDRLSPQAAAHISEDRAGLLDWYLADLAPSHPSLRLPLSLDDIAFLLSDDPLATLPFPIPRIVLWHALRPHSGAPDMFGLDDPVVAEANLARWWVLDRAPQLGVEDCLVPDRYVRLVAAESLTPRMTEASGPPPAAPALVMPRADIQVIGPLRQQSGLGRAARLSVETFRGAGLSVLATDFAYGFPSPPADFPELQNDPGTGPAAAALIHLNPDMLPWLFAAGQIDLPLRRAGYFFWELDRPATCDFLALDLVSEIWTASAFVHDVYAPHFKGVVDHVGLATPPIRQIDRSAARSMLRATAGLPAGSFVFLCVFDGFSYVERKNPLGAVRAFQAAFPDSPHVALVIKTHNRPPSGSSGQGALWRDIEQICASDRRIRIIDQTIPHDGVLALICGADVYVSLHRSEGWGLGAVEAMQLRVPVIATAYSGTEDFCTPETAWRVPFTLIPVRHGDYVHAEPHHRWADPDIEAAAGAMGDIYRNPALAAQRAKTALALIERSLSFETIGARYTRALERLLSRA